VPDFLDVKRQEITDRLKELKPQVDEYSRLEAAASALAKLGGSAPTTTAPRRRGPGRPRGSSTRKKAAEAAAAAAPKAATPQVERKKPGRPKGSGKKVGRPPGSATKAASSSTKRRAGRRKGSGTRSKQALRFVKGQPGITIAELAAKMGIQTTYLYRVLPGLEQEGKVEKKGRGYHPKQA
jgi:hypothetical protein